MGRYWSPKDEPGERQFATVASSSLALEAGGKLPSVQVAYETWGSLDRNRSNAVLVLHALTGDSHAAGPAGPGHPTAGWWDGLIGPGAPVDTDRYFVVCPNVLGGCQGTTGPSSLAPDGRPFGSRFPTITIRDQVSVEVQLADHLGIDRWAAVIGGSMGGMRVLEWAIGYPDRLASAVVLAVGAAATAEQIALCSLQIRAICADPEFLGGDYYLVGTGRGPSQGMALARGIAQLSYRTASEFETRFGRRSQEGAEAPLGGQYSVESYLRYQGVKLTERFDPNSYVVLSAAMNHHDVGRGRGGVARALRDIKVPTAVVGIGSDRLYPIELQYELARLIPGAWPPLVIESAVGHDGFLTEVSAVGGIIARVLGSSSEVLDEVR